MKSNQCADGTDGGPDMVKGWMVLSRTSPSDFQLCFRPLKRRMENGSEYRDRNGYQEINNVPEFSYT
jgi:hypothetical protein